MDNAVALVETYLRVNGYFTVTEYPVLQNDGGGRFHTATDIDVLAFRFPRAHSVVEGVPLPDPLLQAPSDALDMLIGEVKEGPAELNAAATSPAVVRAALHRFGCCGASAADDVVRTLLSHGSLRVPAGHALRLVAFGNGIRSGGRTPFLGIPLSHVIEFLQTYIRAHWDALHCAQFKDEAFALLMTLEKARRTAPASVPSATRGQVAHA